LKKPWRFCLHLWAWAYCSARWRWVQRDCAGAGRVFFLGWVALVWVYVWSTPWVSTLARTTIESAHPAKLAAEVDAAPVAIVLGGGVLAPVPPVRLTPDLRKAADRVWYAAQLYHAGRVERILLAGGVDSRIGGISEAASMRLFIRDLGVPDAALILESGSANTRENAIRVVEMLKELQVGRVLLVTSALHMPRAKRQFEGQGLEVIPAATDHEAVDTAWDIRKLLPDADSLDGSGSAIKEWVGLWAGR